jgi:hypothetical protein
MATRRQRTPTTKAIEDIWLRDVDDKGVRLGSLWEDGPAVLVWLRHYG